MRMNIQPLPPPRTAHPSAPFEAVVAGPPLEFLLTRALRRLARRAPAAIRRLGPFRTAVYIIRPTGLPLAFRLVPDGVWGRVAVLAAPRPTAGDAWISGPINSLVALLQHAPRSAEDAWPEEVEAIGDIDAITALRAALAAAAPVLAEGLGQGPLSVLLTTAETWSSGDGAEPPPFRP